MLVTKTTNGIKITVDTEYRKEHSNPDYSNYLFSYKIRIENNSSDTVQLLKRHWKIYDTSGEYREVKGDGVVGIQPILGPNDIHEYESACNLYTDMGKMFGTYIMLNKSTGQTFEVTVPVFEMYATFRMN